MQGKKRRIHARQCNVKDSNIKPLVLQMLVAAMKKLNMMQQTNKAEGDWKAMKMMMLEMITSMTSSFLNCTKTNAWSFFHKIKTTTKNKVSGLI